MKLAPLVVCLLTVYMANWASVMAKCLSTELPADVGDMAESAVSKQDMKRDTSKSTENQNSNQSEESGTGNGNGDPDKGSSTSDNGGIVRNVAAGATKGTATLAGDLTLGTVTGTATVAKDVTFGALSPVTTTISSLLAPFILPFRLMLFPIEALIYPIIKSFEALIFLTHSLVDATTVFADNVSRRRRSTDNNWTDDTFLWWNRDPNYRITLYLTTMARFCMNLLSKRIIPWANETLGDMMKTGELPSQLVPLAKAFENMYQVLEVLGYINTNP